MLTITVISSAGITWRSPSTNLAPPVPPVRTQIMQPSVLARPESSVAARSFSDRSPGLTAQPEEIPDRPADAGAT